MTPRLDPDDDNFRRENIIVVNDVVGIPSIADGGKRFEKFRKFRYNTTLDIQFGVFITREERKANRIVFGRNL